MKKHSTFYQKHFFLLFLLTAVSIMAFSQILQPVKWSFDSKKISDTEYDLILTATVDEGWHVYAIDIPPGGPIPTSFTFEESDNYELFGDLKYPKPIDKYDKAFEMDLSYFDGSADFVQRIKVLKEGAFEIKGELEFMACDDSRCLPPDYVEYAFNIGGAVAKQNPASPEKILTEKDQEKTQKIEIQPVEDVKIEIVDNEQQKTDDGESDSLLTFFFIALGLGFVGLLTPCVYPMIPMTVSFFMNASQNKLKAKSQALFFGVSIIFIYTFIGILVSVIFGADAIKTVSSHWLTNLIFFLLFAVFAASFFGMFEIVLPSWLTNKSDKQVDKGGYVGSFFMALTLVLVSFSCTAPFVGGILVEASTGEILKPAVGMFGFSLAFGVVFTLLAMFPSFLNKMPKSGGWLNSVKVVLAFLILAIGMKYLLVPNTALGWDIPREVFVAVWIVLFTLLGFYLLGKIQFSHDSPIPYVSVPRLVFVIIAFTFAIYLVPGMFGAPLKVISGYLPSESSWDLDEIIIENTRNISFSSGAEGLSSEICDEPKYDDLFHLPHGLQGYFDLEQGLACAKELNKPVFLDIKGHACTNCKVMEKNVWSDPEVLKRLSKDFVIIALYVDEKTSLPENEWITSSFDGKVKKTIGRKNTDYQITKFGVNAQPYYVIMDANQNVLNDPIAFELDVDTYVEWLDEGVAAYK